MHTQFGILTDKDIELSEISMMSSTMYSKLLESSQQSFHLENMYVVLTDNGSFKKGIYIHVLLILVFSYL